MQKTITIKGFNIFGAEREYTFNLIDADTGLRMFHEFDFASLMMASAEAISMATPDKDVPTDGAGVLIVVKMFTGLVSWDDAEKMFAILLAGAVVEADGEKHTISATGKAAFAPADPSEQYLAVAHALFANFPDYASFFGGAVEDSDLSTEADEAAAE